MSQNVEQALAGAVLTLLRPLARILLRNGIAYGTFAELAKKVYVDVAYEEFATPGRKQTISRVSALTGLTRKEARRLLAQERPDDQGANARYNRAVRVISGWLNDPRYCHADGTPRALPLEGGNPGFADLVKEYSGDIPTRAMLQTLLDAGSVSREDGRIRLLVRAYVPGRDPVDKIHILGTDAAELMATIDHNLTAGEGDPWFQRKVSNDRVAAGALPRFRRLAAGRAQALLEELDQWLGEHECRGNEGQDGEEARYVSLGIYYHEHDPNENREDRQERPP